MKFFVFHTPELTPADSRPDCAIAIDVLRATTTIAAALNAGAEAVQVFSSIDKLLQTSADWPAEKRLRAGERGGAPVTGCDMGNSPLDCSPDRVAGRRLFMSTTNGTRCLERIQSARDVLTGALVNRQAVVSYLLDRRPETIWLVGSGWEGSYALEDTVCAGAIAQTVMERSGVHDLVHADEWIGNDEAVGAIALYQQWRSSLLSLMHCASHGKRLERLERFDDLKYCAELDSLDVLPIQKEPGVLVKY